MIATLETVMQQVNQAIAPQVEQKLRGSLANQPKEWLIDQLVQLMLARQPAPPTHRHQPPTSNRTRAERIARLRQMGLNSAVLSAFLKRYQAYDRERLLAEGYLLPSAPVKGTSLITKEQRTAKGNHLLQQAKDLLFGLLFGDENTQTHFDRVERELLTFLLPRSKAAALSFMKASTEWNAVGAWQDPANISNDTRADNLVFEIEYGEVKEELIGEGIVRCLSLINHLEVNEQILYARMINIEQSTLIA